MTPKAKVILAGAVLLAGATAAFVFRKPAVPRGGLAARAPRVVLESSSSGKPSDAPAAAPHFLGRIDPVDRAKRPSIDGAEDTPARRDPLESEYSGDDEMPAESPWSQGGGRRPLGAQPAAARSPLGEAHSDDEDAARSPRAPRRTHRLVDGDTLSSLAQRYLGRADRYGEIFEANRELIKDPDILPIGARLTIPPEDAPTPTEAGPETAPLVAIPPETLRAARQAADQATQATATGEEVRAYRVQAGDTLAGIARRIYNDSRRYKELYEANRDQLKSPDDLREGMLLVIP